ncbi:hypothetical protein P43SY_002457 [Pythium insidiosum]|uniref:Pumilio domain-containing protein NOP9 n=1 Tax=Pythium insidiosum TaxID=114742 RepID=A0AAD5MDC6_PYTIN|nr:hypothetical protein P43SY_002457 [Pythium insidiosum]
MAPPHDEEPQTSASAGANGQRPERLRPRRLEPDTLSYLKEVAESLTQSGGDELTADEAEMMLWNVLEELAPRAASASSDRHGGEIIEAILPRMSDGQLRFFLSKMEGYFSHLWTNRYSSHVLQNVLARAGLIVDREVSGGDDLDDGDMDERLQGTPAMSEIIVNMVSELEREWLTLMNDVSASHVWRSVLAVLAGRPLAPEKRGKKGKHRALGPALAKDDASAVQLAVPASFEALYGQFVRTFRHAPTAAMLDYVYDRNSGPLIAMALRLAPGKLQSKLAQHLLQWSDEAASAQTFYDYAGETVASHVLEAVFASVSDDFFAAILRRCMLGKLLEFSQHSIANFVVQHALQRVAAKDLAAEVLAELETATWTLFSMGRAGVVWRLVEMCRRVGLHEQQIFTAVVEAVKKQENKKPEPARKELVPALLALTLATGADSSASTKVHLNVVGAKILAEFLATDYADWLKPLYDGILSLNTAQLLALAMDSTGSRCIVEPIWESADDERRWVREGLYAKFVGHFGSLALDRLGAFSVMKCFEKLALREKAAVAEELSAVEGKLQGSHFAQLVMNTVHLLEFMRNREKWQALFEKKDKIADLFKDVVGGDDDADDAAPGDKKLKQKQKKDKKRAAAESEAPAKKKAKKARGAVELPAVAKAESQGADIDVIMGALRGSLASSKDAKKQKKKKKKQSNDDEDDD